MVEFTVKTSLPKDKLAFVGGKVVENFLKPEETADIALVSQKFELNALEPNQKGWKLFSGKLKGLMEQDKNPTSLTDDLKIKEHAGRNQLRVAISSTGPVEKQPNGQKPEFVTLSMKLKLLSNIPVNSSDQEKEQGCLVKLARLCGPKNVDIFIDLDDNGENGRNGRAKDSLSRYRLSWNENDLLWEAEEKMSFRKSDRELFGKTVPCFAFGMPKIELVLNDAGVNRVLQQIYGKPGDNWLRQRKLLMAGAYSDLVIISNHNRHQGNQTPIKCHKVHLAGTSKVFTDMFRDCTSTAEAHEAPIISLPESEDALRAMLHFIYYGGTDGIYGSCVNLSTVLELLDAGKRYKIPNLVEVVNFVLSTKSSLEDKAVELCCESLEGEMWKQKKKEAFDELSRKPMDQLMKSNSFMKIYEIAEKLGPVFVSVLSRLKYFHRMEMYVPYSEIKVSKEETELIYNFICSGEDYLFPRNLDIAVGLIILAEFCGKNLPPFADWISTRFFGEIKNYQADYLVDLFCLAREREQGVKFWRELKMGAIRKLKLMMLEEPLMIEQSYKYQNMLRSNIEAADELKYTSVRIMEEGTKRKRFI